MLGLDIYLSKFGCCVGGSEGGAAAALYTESNFLERGKNCLGGARPMRLKSKCSAQEIGGGAPFGSPPPPHTPLRSEDFRPGFDL